MKRKKKLKNLASKQEIYTKSKKIKKYGLAIFLLMSSIYFLTSRGQPISGDEVRQFYAGIMLYERGVPYVAKGMCQVTTHNGNYTINDLPGNSITLIPFYLLSKYIPLKSNIRYYYLWPAFRNIFLSALLCTIIFIFNYKITKHLIISLIITLFFGLGSCFWYYTKTWRYQVMVAALLFLAFYYLYQYKSEPQKDNLVVWASIFIAISVLSMHIIGIVFIIFLSYLLHIKIKLHKISIKKISKYIAIFSIPTGIAVLIILWWNWIRFGNIFWIVPPKSFYDPLGFTPPTDKFSLFNSLYHLIVYFTYRNSLLFFAPWMIFAFIGFKTFYKKNLAECLLILSMFLLFFIFYGGFENIWSTTGEYGHRYFLPLLPFLTLPAAFGIFKIIYPLKEKRRNLIIIYSIMALFIFINFTNVLVNYREYRFALDFIKGDIREKYSKFFVVNINLWKYRRIEIFIMYNRFCYILKQKVGIFPPLIPFIEDPFIKIFPPRNFHSWVFQGEITFFFWILLFLSLLFIYKSLKIILPPLIRWKEFQFI